MRRRIRVGAALRRAALVGIAVVVVGCGGAENEPRGPLPDILLVTLDTTRADRLSCYGYRRITSPNIDRIARSGTLFENAIAQASVTPVSHAAIFTGRNPYANGLRVLHGPVAYVVRKDVPMLAEVLGDVGYTSGGFIAALPCGERFALQRGFDFFDDPFTNGGEGEGSITEVGIVNTNDSQRRASDVNRAVLDWVGGQSDEDPVFVWAHYFDPHDVRMLPEGGEASLTRFPRDPNPTRRKDLLWAYDNEIHYMDEHVGALVEAMGRRDRPLLICIVGDHGEGHGDHDWWSHGILYQEQIRVPMILAGDPVPVGRRIDSLVRTIDVAPTLLSLIGENPSRRMQGAEGVDLTPLLEGREDDLGLVAYAESVTTGMGYLDHSSEPKPTRNQKDDELYSVIRDGWKYIHHVRNDGEAQPHELYDLTNDPRELTNVAAQHPERVAEFRSWLQERGVLFDPRYGTIGADMDEATRARLEQLGYLGAEDDEDDENEKKSDGGEGR